MPVYHHPICDAAAGVAKGPVFGSRKSGFSCTHCGHKIHEGERIRAVAKREPIRPPKEEAGPRTAPDDDSDIDDGDEPLPTPIVESPLAKAIVQEIWPAIEPRLRVKAPVVDIQEIVRLVKSEVSAPIVFEIKREGHEPEIIEKAHRQFGELLPALQARCNLWITGPAGGGKSTAAKMAAKALGLRFGFEKQILDPITQITGWRDGSGHYHRPLFRDFWENGGLFVFEEADGSDPNAVLSVNPFLDRHCGEAPFPDGMVPRHPDFVLVACGNAIHGATNEYVGRFKPDAAFLNRFVCIDWQYDEDLESRTCGNPEWAGLVQKLRKATRDLGIKHSITPRASYEGAQLLRVGASKRLAFDQTIGNFMREDQRALILSHIGGLQ